MFISNLHVKAKPPLVYDQVIAVHCDADTARNGLLEGSGRSLVSYCSHNWYNFQSTTEVYSIHIFTREDLS